ncbi:MAG: hypothetical protein KAI71_02330 [Candidatus Pacebacteria bacterium]|nr:hypothetical protein [Candidatus Paceibacterota bacterium]
MPIFNDENLKNWKESEIWTDSLWMISEQDKSGKYGNISELLIGNSTNRNIFKKFQYA